MLCLYIGQVRNTPNYPKSHATHPTLINLSLPIPDPHQRPAHVCSHLLIPHGWPHKRGTTVILCVLNIFCPWRRLMLCYFEFKHYGQKPCLNMFKNMIDVVTLFVISSPCFFPHLHIDPPMLYTHSYVDVSSENVTFPNYNLNAANSEASRPAPCDGSNTCGLLRVQLNHAAQYAVYPPHTDLTCWITLGQHSLEITGARPSDLPYLPAPPSPWSGALDEGVPSVAC